MRGNDSQPRAQSARAHRRSEGVRLPDRPERLVGHRGMPAPCLVLRRLPPGTTAARARFVTAVHHHAGCAPSLLANDEGERLTPDRGRYFQLVQYVITG
jgi:hypothetical protein